MKKTTRTENLPKIILLLRIDIASGRQQMSGIFRYIRDGHPWNVRLQHPATFTRTALREAIKDGIDGIIASENDIAEISGRTLLYPTARSVRGPGEEKRLLLKP